MSAVISRHHDVLRPCLIPSKADIDRRARHVRFPAQERTHALQQNPNELSPTIAFGADLYHGLGGNDFVTLPDKANYNEDVRNGTGGSRRVAVRQRSGYH